jgi:starvation-inducible DNA-binding protein
MAVGHAVVGPLADHERDRLAWALQSTLVDLVDLALVGKQAHWNVVGRQFHDVHLHLDELVDTARRYADEVAERAAALGIAPDGRASVIAASSALPEFPAGWVEDRDVVRWISEAVDAVVRRVRTRIDEAEKVDVVTQDLFTDIVRALEKARWMWQAQSLGGDAS